MEVENVNVKNWKSLIKPSKLDVMQGQEKVKQSLLLEKN